MSDNNRGGGFNRSLFDCHARPGDSASKTGMLAAASAALTNDEADSRTFTRSDLNETIHGAKETALHPKAVGGTAGLTPVSRDR